jgi:hypothetical protein
VELGQHPLLTSLGRNFNKEVIGVFRSEAWDIMLPPWPKAFVPRGGGEGRKKILEIAQAFLQRGQRLADWQSKPL